MKLAAIAALLLVLPSMRADASSTEYILPDSDFVQSECARLAALYKDVNSLQGAHRAVAQACAVYKGDGDAWFAAVKDPRNDIDGYDPHPELHAYLSLPPSAPVPRRPNVPYVLFLAPDLQWVKANGKDLTLLHDAIVNFGDAIGGEGLAIWFAKDSDPASIDVARSARYCTQVFHFGSHYGLSLNGGPYIIFTGTRPDGWSKANDLVILKLSGLTQSQIIELLNDLEQQLLEGKKPDERSLLFSEMEFRLATLAQRHANVFHTIALFIFKGTPGFIPSQ